LLSHLVPMFAQSCAPEAVNAAGVMAADDDRQNQL
jgi:hypothetical protein